MVLEAQRRYEFGPAFEDRENVAQQASGCYQLSCLDRFEELVKMRVNREWLLG